MSLRSILTKVQEIKTTHWDFRDANSEQLKKLDKVLIQECATIMVQRKELKDKLRGTSWKELADQFSLNPTTVLTSVVAAADEPTAGDVLEDSATVGVTDATAVAALSDSVAAPLIEEVAAVEDELQLASPASSEEADQPGDETFITIKEVFSKLAELLKWSDKKKAKVLVVKRIEELCFSEKCPSTSVLTSELIKLLVKNGMFGEEVGSDYVPARGQAPSFLARLRLAPARISRAQLRKLYIEDFRFGELIQTIDKNFFELQEEAFKKSGIKRASDKGLAKTQIQGTRVSIARFYKKVLKKKFLPLESHPFWATTIGGEWKVSGEKALLEQPAGGKSESLSWREVYQGLQQIAPNVSDAIHVVEAESNGLYDVEKSRMGVNRSSMSHLESVGEDDDDLTAPSHLRHSSSLSFVSPDELAQLQMQLKQSASKNTELMQQLGQIRSLMNEKDALIESLQASANALKSDVQMYTAEHLQQAVDQTRKQYTQQLTQYQQQYESAKALLQAARSDTTSAVQTGLSNASQSLASTLASSLLTLGSALQPPAPEPPVSIFGDLKKQYRSRR